MSRLQLRGVIVPSDYDDDWTQGYIERGIITPESFFRRELGEASTDEPLEVYVNSPGGSVFAANEMINAVRDWKTANSQPATVVIGALAASAASAFTISVADKVQAHSNAKMMFHGAWGLQVGGAEAMKDYSEILEKVNADIKTRLVSRYNMDPDTVAEWFSEGREGWLTADEMLAAGIADEVASDSADTIEFPAEAIEDFEAHGIGIAALLDQANKTESDDDADNSDESESEEEGTDAGDESDAEDTTGEDQEQSEETGSDAEPDAKFEAGKQAGRSEALAEHTGQLTELTASLEAARAEASKHQAAHDKAVSDAQKIAATHAETIEKMSTELKDANDRLAKLLDGSLKFSAAPSTWQEALDACGGDYARTAKSYPELRDKFNAEHSSDKK